jgi:hypothetical protein
MNTVFGSWAGNMRAIHSLCRPTSEISRSSRPIALRISHSARGGCIGNASSSFADMKRPRTMSFSRESGVSCGAPRSSSARRVRMW